MKSIVQEGSTISKAVESAWQSAGKPTEFTVKVLEEPIHNFIGMTTRSAKVALFYKEPYSSGKQSHDKSDRYGKNDRHERSNDKHERTNDRTNDRDNRTARPKKQQRTPRPEGTQQPKAPFVQPKERPARTEFHATEEAAPTRTRPSYDETPRPTHHEAEGQDLAAFDGVFWTPEMITMAKDWLQGSLVALDLPNMNYTTEVNRLYFKVEFADPVNANVATERQIFRSFAMLLMQHMRNRLKRPLKGFKVVLSRGGLDVEEAGQE